MKCIHLALYLATVITILRAKSPSAYDYHRRFGIPRAKQIKKWEERNVRYADFQRIVGGWTVDISHFPYQGGIIIDIEKMSIVYQSICSASLISKTHLLTAAHCKDDGNMVANFFTVVLGSNFIFSGGHRVDTMDIVIHPSWDYANFADIAIVYVPRVPISDLIQPITLPSDKALALDFNGWLATTSGFGLTTDGGKVSNNQRLSAVAMPVITNEACTIAYGASIVSTHICISGVNGRGICDGDSGGPLTVSIDNKTTLIGVSSSSSINSCDSGQPNVFTRVASFIKWIRMAMKPQMSQKIFSELTSEPFEEI